ncbi:hypothetical protein GGH94_002659 [Coemansia aciculifera]|uniref:BHLH domain-containing protein n=1 Tax=Coemansia aciculifera TaxID=417176 RepID=A0A9W8IIN8_9FUNG|nr:hypothetical protein GGH94_002659 [Coemansia aciculifera]KAJ2874408.1 hypothetical protein GGH93_002420 [Coemansia aciculifera]
MPNESPVDDGPGSFEADSSLFLPNSDFFENLPRSSTLPLRPPSIPPDLEPAPLFTPKLAPLSNPDDGGDGGTTTLHPPSSYSGNALGLRFDLLDHSPAFHADSALQQRHTYSYSAAGESSRPTQPTGPPPPIDTLFDNNEESYLNSFLNSFDADGFDLGTYLASPPPMANFSSNTDFTGMGMGMGVGAGMMGAMDDAIPHLSVDENTHDTTHGISHMTAPSAAAAGTRSHAGGSGGMLPMRRQSFFDYGMGGSSHLSLGNVMTEEMHKVSSWLLQNQDHQSEAPQSLPTNSTLMPRSLHRASVDGGQHSTHVSLAHSMGMTSPLGYPTFPSAASGRVLSASAARTTFPIDSIWPHDGYGNYGQQQQQQQQHRPPSDSELSVKRKASFEQISQPRKARGSMWSPMRETAPPLIAANSTAGAASNEHSHVMIGTATLASLVAASRSAYDATAPEDPADANSGSGDEGSIDGDGSSRRDHKKSTQRTILTEDERRANHIASEQRRRNQIRQGYAELMNMVTTLRDPALGNHPGTAQSTPSKAVILSHAVQFIRNLEDGNRQLRERLEGSRHLLPPMHLASQALASLQSRPTGPPQ